MVAAKKTLQRQLTDRERGVILHALERVGVAPASLCREAVETCLLSRQTPLLGEIDGVAATIAYAALKTRASGITLGNRVFIRREYFSDEGEIPLDLLAHEVAHVVQFMRDGTLGFLARYLRDYVLGVGRGLGDQGAYLAIPYEVEARQVADALPAHPSRSA